MRKWAAGVILGASAIGAATMGAAAASKPKVAQADPNAKVGVVTRVFHPAARRNWRGAAKQELDTLVWYPAVETAVETRQYVGDPEHPLFEAGSAMPHAEFAPHMERVPLVLISHGTGGSAVQMAWLGTALARAGYIAVAVDHPGNTSNGKLTPEGMALWWERATDLSEVLDGMLKDDDFGPRIDPQRIAAAGYSLGGYTVLELAGAQTDISQLFDRCRITPGKPNPEADATVCQETRKVGMGTPEEVLAAVRKTSGVSLASSSGSFRDPRIKAVFAIAPALGFTQTGESLRAIRIPVAMVVGSDDVTAPARENADYLRANIHGARETILPGVRHYTFLDPCTAMGGKLLPQFCGDAPGIDRAAVEAQVAGMAVTFFDRALKWR